MGYGAEQKCMAVETNLPVCGGWFLSSLLFFLICLVRNEDVPLLPEISFIDWTFIQCCAYTQLRQEASGYMYHDVYGIDPK